MQERSRLQRALLQLGTPAHHYHPVSSLGRLRRGIRSPWHERLNAVLPPRLRAAFASSRFRWKHVSRVWPTGFSKGQWTQRGRSRSAHCPCEKPVGHTPEASFERKREEAKAACNRGSNTAYEALSRVWPTGFSRGQWARRGRSRELRPNRSCQEDRIPRRNRPNKDTDDDSDE